MLLYGGRAYGSRANGFKPVALIVSAWRQKAEMVTIYDDLGARASAQVCPRTDRGEETRGPHPPFHVPRDSSMRLDEWHSSAEQMVPRTTVTSFSPLRRILPPAAVSGAETWTSPAHTASEGWGPRPARVLPHWTVLYCTVLYCTVRTRHNKYSTICTTQPERTPGGASGLGALSPAKANQSTELSQVGLASVAGH